MSDLQCPATVVFVLPTGDVQVRDSLADELRERRVAQVYSGDDSTASATGTALGAFLDVPVARRAGLGEIREDEDDHAAVVRVSLELAELTDVHRGETVVVVGHPRVLAATLPSLARDVTGTSAEGLLPSPGRAVALRADADGWVTAP